MKKLFLIFTLCFIIKTPFFAQIFLQKDYNESYNFFEFNQNIEKYAPKDIDKKKGFKPVRRLQYLRQFRVDKTGKIPPVMNIHNEYNNFNKRKNSNHKLSKTSWQEIGPRLPQKGPDKKLSGSGRVNCIAFDPLDSNLIWVGSASGGLWFTTNRGVSWDVVPFTEFLSMGVSDIAISSTNPNIIYVATGDADGSSFFGCYSMGIIKSTDKGKTWEILPTGIEYINGGFISKLLLHPNDDNLLLAATSNSIIKTSDGGKTWKTVIEGLNFRDLKYKPGDFCTIYATTYSVSSGVFLIKSEDCGESWFIANYWKDASRVKLATTPLQSERLLALAVNKYNNSFGGLYLSDSEGYFWQTLIDDTTNYSFIVQAQGFFNLVLEFLPNSKDEFYAGGVWLYRGKINSKEFKAIPNETHVDMHDIKYNSHDGKIYLANDGGLYRFNQDFTEIENISKNLGITQFYRIGLNPFNPSVFYGGSQDNNVYQYFYENWQFLWGGDGMECFVSPENPSLVYFSTQRGNLYNTEIGLMEVPTDEKRPWVTPFLYHPKHPQKVYCGYENVWLTTDKGKNWEKISNFNDSLVLVSITVSNEDTNLIAAANINNVYISKDSGKNWEKIFSSDNPITFTKFDKYQNLWITLGGFDRSNKVFLFKNGQLENHSFNLPNVPTTCIEIDSTTDNVFVGTDIGVFYKKMNDNDWSIAGNSLPAVIINELEIHYGTGTLFAATFGRGIWSLKLWECPMEKPIIAVPERVIFCPDESVILEVANPNPDHTYIWNDGTKGRQKIVTEKGNYYVCAIDKFGCTAASDTVYLWKPAVPQINLVLLTANPICEGDTARVLAIYRIIQKAVQTGWSDGRVGNLGQFTQRGRYYFWLMDEFSCKYISDTIEIFVNQLPPKPEIRKVGNWLETNVIGNIIWFHNGKELPNIKDNRCFIFSPGKYYLIVRDSNLCANVSDTIEINFNDKLEANMQVRLSPVPTGNHLNIEINLLEETPLEILIYNTLGQILYKKEISSGKGYLYEQINLTNFAKSVYYLMLKNKFGNITKVFVVI